MSPPSEGATIDAGPGVFVQRFRFRGDAVDFISPRI